jgi:hypothetical protein
MHPRAGSLLGLLRRDRQRWSWAVVVALLLAVLAPQPLPAAPDLLAGAICVAGGEHQAPQEQHHGGQPECCVFGCATATPALGTGPAALALRLPIAAVLLATVEGEAPPSARLRIGAASPRGPPAAA